MDKERIIVGEKVYLKPVNNAARGGNKEIREEYIIKIGRKYFFVGKEGETNERLMVKFNIDDLRQVTDYSPNWIIYFSKQEILDTEESIKLTREIKEKFNTWGNVGLSLDQLKRIKDIISE
ncbi:hypothetical protein [Metabacillus fastidiosus]|uniref:beta barrel domain-containing protein n=1 Tax=Metabacillus fastidiosus TaxID=1458 RepID=UPI003D297547